MKSWQEVTILILIDGFLQCVNPNFGSTKDASHNPYFNRWFSAIGGLEEYPEAENMSQSLF